MGWNKPAQLVEPRCIQTPSVLSADAVLACAGFGLSLQHANTSAKRVAKVSQSTLKQIYASSIVLITGASGSGKSCLVRGIHRATKHTKVHLVPTRLDAQDQSIAMIDLLTGPIERRVSTLASAGLAEPGLWALPGSCLSAGQQARLLLAITMHKTKPGEIVIADEFATPLDRVSAYSLAHTVRRWALRKGITIIAATAHEDMGAMLCPDQTIDASSALPIVNTPPIHQPIRFEQGSIDDYRQLAHLHYRSGTPATHTQVLRAIRTCPIVGDLLAGVLMISMPTLNSAWRDRAWPGFFSTKDKSLNTRRLNAHLRCISRVIIEPRSRGLGIASGLVRHYLHTPETPATESIAAMGSVCPFFEHAGMTPYPLVPAPADLRLIDALNAEHIKPSDLMSQTIEPGSLTERELAAWAKAKRLIGSGAHKLQTIQRLAPIAACRLLCRPRAYAHVHTKGDSGDDIRTHTG